MPLRQCFGAAESSKLRFSSARRHSALERTFQSDFEATSRSKFIRSHVQRNCSNMLGSAPLHSVSVCSVSPYSVHRHSRSEAEQSEVVQSDVVAEHSFLRTAISSVQLPRRHARTVISSAGVASKARSNSDFERRSSLEGTREQ